MIADEPLAVATPSPASQVKAGVVCVLLDETGSMEDCVVETVTGYNAFVDQLKVAQRASGVPTWYSAYRFDKWPGQPLLREIVEGMPIEEVGLMTDFRPRGHTALYDAIGQTIHKLDEVVAKANADRVVLMIQTDGDENASTEYSMEAVRNLIAERKARGWEVIFLGGDLGVARTRRISQGLGNSAGQTVAYAKAHSAVVMRASAANAGSYISGQSVNTEFTAKQRTEAGENA